MQTENLTKNQRRQIIEAVESLQNQATASLVKNDLLDMYKASLAEDEYNVTAMQRIGKFHSFQHLYNLLLTVQMQYEPTETGINLLVS